MNKRQTGADQEVLAAVWLEKQGLRILEKNYRCRQGEIDLIARDGRYLVFVEVKYRKGIHTGHPSEAVDPVSYTHLDVYKRQESPWR